MTLGLAWCLPFAGMLLSIALMPLVAPDLWARRYGFITLGWGLAFAAPLLAFHGDEGFREFLHVALADYLPFLILLWALYTVTGGIHVTGTPAGTPAVNTLILLIGTLLASVVGTTGAAMLLVRPLIRANSRRKHRAHQMVFFIFLVCNVGGSLTPIGDPPLFLGFLHGVPFTWTLKLFPAMGLTALALLALFYFLDSHLYRGHLAPLPDPDEVHISVEGKRNFLYLAGLLAAVVASGVADLGTVQLLGVPRPLADLLRDGALLALGLASYLTTGATVRAKNRFGWHPIKEVAILFAGIFATMIPALLILKAGREGAAAGLAAAVSTPADYFWATGLLSSFLDNTPTYLVFFTNALGALSPSLPEAQAVKALLAENAQYLKAISLGAVFMGAFTYIGNAPNFMVLAIAEEEGIKMPSFFGYLFRYSLPLLVPVFILVTFLFF